MFRWLFRRSRHARLTYRPVAPPHARRVVLTAACRDAIQASLAPEITRQHEGIVYLLGQTDGHASLIVTAYRPQASTNRGSFHVVETAMRPVVEAASTTGLQVVGQLHTHPGDAYHSAGDETGALIRFNGFVSIVLPDYGTRLPNFDGAALYMFSTDECRFVQLALTDLSVLPERLP